MKIVNHSVYEITGHTGVYVGKTSSTLAARWRAHKAAARRGSAQHIHRAIRTYGAEAFSVVVVLQSRTAEDAYACEMIRIAQRRAEGARLYNGDNGGLGGPGRVQTAAEKAKRSASMRGWAKRAGLIVSAEARANMRDAQLRLVAEGKHHLLRAENRGPGRVMSIQEKIYAAAARARANVKDHGHAH